MLITHENILRRFTENLVWATGIDLATAWATSNGGLRALQDRNVSFEVRSVVGLWGTTTTPNALGTLARMGELRVAVSDHRKTYFFGLSPTGHRSRQPRLWRGIGGNGSVQRLNRPQIEHRQRVGERRGAGELIVPPP